MPSATDVHAHCREADTEKIALFRQLFDGVPEVDLYIQDAISQDGDAWICKFRCGTEIAEDFVMYLEYGGSNHVRN